MRLRRDKDDSQAAGTPGSPYGIAPPAPGAAPGSAPKGPLAAPDRNAIRSVGVAILPGVPLPEWATTATAPPGTWTAPAAVPYADPRAAGTVPASPYQPVPGSTAGVDPALAALAPPSSPLPPPDPAQWSERPAGPVVWGPAPVAPRVVPTAPPQYAPAQPAAAAPATAVPQANPWFTPETLPPPATSAAGQYGWLVQPDVLAGAAPAAGAPAAPAMAPPAGPSLPAPASAPAPPDYWSVPGSVPGEQSLAPGIPQQIGPERFDPQGPDLGATPPGGPGSVLNPGPTSTTAPIAWVRAESSQPSATVAGTPAPVHPWAEPVLQPAGVPGADRHEPTDDGTARSGAPMAMAAGGAWALAEQREASARLATPMPQPAPVPMQMPMQMPLPTGRPVPLPPPDVPGHPFGGVSPGWGPADQGPGFASPPPGAVAPDQSQATFPPEQPVTQSDARPSGRRIKVLLAILVALALVAAAAVALFVTPGFLRSSDASSAPPVVRTPDTVAGLQKTAPAPAATTYLKRVAATTGAAATSQFATYSDGGSTSATVWIANASGGSPTASALAFQEAAGPPLEPLQTVSAGPRGGEMGCAAANANRTVCFWNANGVRGAADIRGMGRAQSAALAAQLRIGLEQPAPAA